MGARGSTLQGRADVEPRVRGFTAYDTKEIDELLLRHKHDLGGRLALGPKHAKVLLGLDPNTAASIFADVFDTDRNKLVDAFELISALILVSRLGAPQKIRCVHALFDFNGTGDLNLDELTILLRTVAAGCGKVDRNVVPPTMLEFERMTKWAFLKAKREEDEEIAFVEFERFVLTEPTIRALLDYFTEGASEVALEPGTLWFDGGVPLFRDAARPPPGLPRQAGVVTLQRPGEFFKLGASTPKLFTSETNYGQIVEGALSEAWLLSALAILMTRREAVRRIFSKTGQEARGRYAVNLWRGGQSSVVFVDDLFPIFASGDRFFARSTDASELWVMLVEKAWAKVLGSYEALGDGNVSVDEALHALTGGPAHARRDVATCAGDDLWRNLGLWLEQGVCGFSSETNSGADGLLKGRCYGVLRIVDHAGAKLVQLSNKWARGGTVKGRWAVGSPSWTADAVLACDFDAGDSQTFWLDVSEIQKAFSTVYVCRIFDAAVWTCQRRCADMPTMQGGCLDHAGWVSNPQFFLDLPEAAQVCVEVSRDGGGDLVSLGVVVASHAWGPRFGASKLAAVTNANLRYSSAALEQRHTVTVHLDLAAGQYAIIPVTAKEACGGAVSVTTKSPQPHVLLNDAEVISDAETAPTVGKTDLTDAVSAVEVLHAQLPAYALPPHLDQAAIGVRELSVAIGKMWSHAHQLQYERTLLQQRVAALTGGLL